MDLLEHVAAAGGHDPHLFADMAMHFVGRAVTQHVTRVAAATPERQILAEFPLQPRQFHVRAGKLHRVDGVQAGLDHVAQQGIHAAAAVEADLDVWAELLGVVPQNRVPRLEELAIHRGRNLRSLLHAQIIAETDQVQVLAHRPKVLVHVRQVELGQFVEEAMDTPGVGGELVKEVVDAEGELADLDQVAAEGAVNRSIGRLTQLARCASPDR